MHSFVIDKKNAVDFRWNQGHTLDRWDQRNDSTQSPVVVKKNWNVDELALRDPYVQRRILKYE